MLITLRNIAVLRNLSRLHTFKNTIFLRSKMTEQTRKMVFKYPEARREKLVEDYHGVQVIFTLTPHLIVILNLSYLDSRAL